MSKHTSNHGSDSGLEPMILNRGIVTGCFGRWNEIVKLKPTGEGGAERGGDLDIFKSSREYSS